MPKKLIIGISIALVAIGAAAFAILLIRSRALSVDEPVMPPPIDAPQGSESGLDRPGGLQSSTGGTVAETPAPKAPTGPSCGDGICSEGENHCNPDCGSKTDRFLGSIDAEHTSTSLKISWRTDSPSTGEVRYGKSEKYELGSLTSATPSLTHAVLIEGLTPGGGYNVHVRAVEEDGVVLEGGPLFYELPD